MCFSVINTENVEKHMKSLHIFFVLTLVGQSYTSLELSLNYVKLEPSLSTKNESATLKIKPPEPNLRFSLTNLKSVFHNPDLPSPLPCCFSLPCLVVSPSPVLLSLSPFSSFVCCFARCQDKVGSQERELVLREQ